MLKFMRLLSRSNQNILRNVQFRFSSTNNEKWNNIEKTTQKVSSSKNLTEQYFKQKRNFNFEFHLVYLTLVFSSSVLAYLLYSKFSKKFEYAIPKKKEEKDPFVTSCKITKMPLNASEIPDKVPYLLIGGGTASFSAFRAIKTADPTAKVLVVTKEPHMPYMRPPLNKRLLNRENETTAENLKFKDWAGKVRSLYYEHPEFYVSCKDLQGSKNGGVAVAYGWDVTNLDVAKKEIELDGGKKIKYDKCLIATGAKPKTVEVLENANENMKSKFTYFRGVEDYQQLSSYLPGIKSIAILGGGFLGCELACALKKKNKDLNVILITQSEGVISDILPQYLSDWTAEQISKEGVEVMTKSFLEDANLINGKLQLHLSDKDIQVDYLVVSVGVEPVTHLAEKAGLEIDPINKGYCVNAEMQAREDLYVAGDCASFYDPKLGRRRVEHHDHAMVTGRLAGENMAKDKSEYYKSQSMFWSDIGPISFEALGIVNSTLPTVAVFPQNDTENENRDEKLNGIIGDKDLSKGVVFYLNNNTIVGIVLWNLMEKLKIAKLIVENGKEYQDLTEVAKYFKIHQTSKEPKLQQASKSVQ